MSIFHRILVPIDGSEPSDAAVALARKIAHADEGASELVFCHVIDVAADYRAVSEAQISVGAQDMVDEDRARGTMLIASAVNAATEAGLKATGEILEGAPAATIVQRAREGDFDLILTGTHGRHGIERLFLGSTAEDVLRHASVPVLAVKSQTP